ncbi:MAG: haloacid dehalogenase [Myxococcales bacterium]|nr:haloacid dehalogenase [Myxococcales bacterium]
MLPIKELTRASAQDIQFVLSDIDDTMTENGKLPACAYQALWELKEAGIKVIPVTGRPAGWCDLIARQWPVDAVVGENGALIYYEENGVLKEIINPQVADTRISEKLTKIRNDVLSRVPQTRIAKDQAYRRFDLAIDFAEEEPKLSLSEAKKIQDIFHEHGAEAKISSIHVNGWFGEYDKLSMTKILFKALWAIDLDNAKEKVLFCGDSPNDEPMFAYFPISCGVANIREFVSLLHSPPAYISDQEAGQGFAECVVHLLSLRNQTSP